MSKLPRRPAMALGAFARHSRADYSGREVETFRRLATPIQRAGHLVRAFKSTSKSQQEKVCSNPEPKLAITRRTEGPDGVFSSCCGFIGDGSLPRAAGASFIICPIAVLFGSAQVKQANTLQLDSPVSSTRQFSWLLNASNISGRFVHPRSPGHAVLSGLFHLRVCEG